MRTSPWERPYIWAEARAGRLRQGWGWNEEINLDLIAEQVALGAELSEKQRIAWRQRRMRTSARDGIQIGDTVVAPNLPQWGQFSVFRVAGPYEYVLDAPRQFDERFGHILPVQLLASSIDRYGPLVSDSLRAMTALQQRLYNITAYGGDVGEDGAHRSVLRPLARCSKAATDGARFCAVDAWELAPLDHASVIRDATIAFPFAILRKDSWRFALNKRRSILGMTGAVVALVALSGSVMAATVFDNGSFETGPARHRRPLPGRVHGHHRLDRHRHRLD